MVFFETSTGPWHSVQLSQQGDGLQVPSTASASSEARQKEKCRASARSGQRPTRCSWRIHGSQFWAKRCEPISCKKDATYHDPYDPLLGLRFADLAPAVRTEGSERLPMCTLAAAIRKRMIYDDLKATRSTMFSGAFFLCLDSFGFMNHIVIVHAQIFLNQDEPTKRCQPYGKVCSTWVDHKATHLFKHLHNLQPKRILKNLHAITN